MKKALIFTNIAPHYREALWETLLNSNSNEIHFYFGEGPKNGIKPIDFTHPKYKNHGEKLHSLKNYWFKKKALIWQCGVVKPCVLENFQTAIFLGDMYCLSTWIAAIICRFRKKKVAFWGHGLYGNEGRFKQFFRLTFLRIANVHLLYERRAKELLISKGFRSHKLYVVFNSLDYEKQRNLRQKFFNLNKRDVLPFFSNPELPLLVFTGRLTESKKLDLLVKAHNQLNEIHTFSNLLIIGDGPKKNELEKLGEKGIREKSLYFTGPLYNEEDVGLYLSVADLCVSPGNVGLTAIHSLTYGTPVCTHNNFANQMPEAGAITQGYNGILFEENNLSDLIQKIKNWVAFPKKREEIREQCIDVVDKFYNPAYQLTVFEKLINGEKPEC